MPLDLNFIYQQFPRKLIDSAAGLQVRVRDIQYRGSVITARVCDDAQDFRTFIQLQTDEDLALKGECNCDKRAGCEHIIATLLVACDKTWMRSQLQEPSDVVTSRLRSRSSSELRYVIQGEEDDLLLELYVYNKNALEPFQAYVPNPRIFNAPPRFIADSDLPILKGLMCLENTNKLIQLLRGQAGLLQNMLQTRRLYRSKPDQVTLILGEPIQGIWVWQMDTSGTQNLRLQLGLSGPTHTVIASNPPYYLCPGAIGVIDVKEKGECLDLLFKQAPIHPEDLLSKEAKFELPKGFLQPKLITDIVDVSTPVKIQLHLAYSHQMDGSRKACAQLSFLYLGQSIKAGAGSAYVASLNNTVLSRCYRSVQQENNAIEWMKNQGWKSNDQHQWSLDSSRQFASFMSAVLPELEELGWQLLIDSDCPRIIDVKGCTLESKEAENHRLSIQIIAKTTLGVFDLLPLLSVLEWQWGSDEFRDGLLAIDDDRWLKFSQLQLQRLRHSFADIHLYQEDLLVSTSRLHEIEQLVSDLNRAENHEPELDSVKDAWITACRLPDTLPVRATLRSYQKDAVSWLQQLSRLNLGCVLADDMGLGKTLQIITHLALLKQQGRLLTPALIVVPTSLLGNWRDEVNRFAPQLKLLCYYGADREKLQKKCLQQDLVVTSYALLYRDKDWLAEQDWSVAILDEAQQIKNPNSQTAKAARELLPCQRICLSGTPLENHLGELWSLFEFSLPGLLGSNRNFIHFFRKPIEEFDSQGRMEALQERIAPFLLRRTKMEVLADLPAKTEIIRKIDLQPAQRRLYDSLGISIYSDLKQRLKEAKRNTGRILILEALMKMRQICCDPRLVKLDEAREVKESAKLEALMSMLNELLGEGRKILIFSQFTSMLDLIEQELQQNTIAYSLLTGKTRHRDRQVKLFQQGPHRVFLISLKAGGTGLNLTAADTVIHYDPWWNPATENQASDRAHRIGQDKSVFVYKLIASNTVEERILMMQKRKQELADSLLSDKRLGSSVITQEQLEELLRVNDYAQD